MIEHEHDYEHEHEHEHEHELDLILLLLLLLLLVLVLLRAPLFPRLLELPFSPRGRDARAKRGSEGTVGDPGRCNKPESVA